MGYIYKIINIDTKKMYIGQTRQDLYERWKHHKKPRSNCCYLKSAIKKYGVKNFEFKLICICFDDDLNNYEKYYIKKYNTMVPNGYNLREGGNGGGKHSEETKKKISNALKNRTDIVYGKSRIGKPLPEEVKQKISNSLKGRKIKPESIQKRTEKNIKYKIFKMNKEGIIIDTFNGYAEAGKNVNATHTTIRAACNGKTKTSKGFFWKSELINK